MKIRNIFSQGIRKTESAISDTISFAERMAKGRPGSPMHPTSTSHLASLSAHVDCFQVYALIPELSELIPARNSDEFQRDKWARAVS